MKNTLTSSDITGLLLAWNAGDPQALEALVPTDTVLRDWRFGKSWLFREWKRVETP
jgi:hypothetical protein